jgi:hypothetical protein
MNDLPKENDTFSFVIELLIVDLSKNLSGMNSSGLGKFFSSNTTESKQGITTVLAGIVYPLNLGVAGIFY